MTKRKQSFRILTPPAFCKDAQGRVQKKRTCLWLLSGTSPAFGKKVRIHSDFNHGNRCPTFFIRYKMLEIVLNYFLFVLLYDKSYGIYLPEKLKKSCAGVPIFAFCISYIHSCLGLDLGCFCILFLA